MFIVFLESIRIYVKKYITKYSNCKPNKKAGRIFKQKCSNPNCSIIVYVTQKDYIEKKNVSCSKECQYKDINPFTWCLNGIKKTAKAKNLEFDLDVNFLGELFEKQNSRCAVTNIILKLNNKKEKAKIYETASLDRINSDFGYIKNNVQWVVLGVNYMKNKHTEEDMNKLLKLIKENYEQDR